MVATENHLCQEVAKLRERDRNEPEFDEVLFVDSDGELCGRSTDDSMRGHSPDCRGVSKIKRETPVSRSNTSTPPTRPKRATPAAKSDIGTATTSAVNMTAVGSRSITPT